MGNFSFTLSDLKKQLGDGLGIRSNKYVVIVPFPGIIGRKLAVLARSTSLPERGIGVAEIYHKGRRYKIRGETDLQNAFTINLTDDSEMKLRQYFDTWLRLVDNPETDLEATSEGIMGGFSDLLNSLTGAVNAASELISEYSNTSLSSVIKGSFFNSNTLPSYQKDVEVYQLNKNNEAIYGYLLQNCFPTEVGAVEISDEQEGEFSQFSVNLTYSDFIPLLPNESEVAKVIKAIAGDNAAALATAGNTLYETLTG